MTSKWGIAYNESFVVTALTPNFVDNARLANIPYVIQAFVYIDYVKGSETALEIMIEESNTDENNPGVELYFVETIADNDGFVDPYLFKLTETGAYRIPLQVGESEDRLRVSVRGAGTPAFTGTATLYYGVR